MTSREQPGFRQMLYLANILAVATTMQTPPIPTTMTADTTRVTKGIKMTTTRGNTMTRELQASNNTKVNAPDAVDTTQKRIRRRSATSQ